MAPTELITAAISSLGALRDLSKLTFDAKVDAKVRAAVVDAVDKLGAAQRAMYEMREELSRLQAENEKFKRQAQDVADWKSKLSEYTFTRTSGGATVYSHNATAEHYACPVCVNEKKLMPLQDKRDLSGRYSCPGCSVEYPINAAQEYRPPRIDYPPRLGGR